MAKYVFFPVIIALVLLYFLTYVLSKKEKISYAAHVRIWNWLLLVSFLGVVVLGLLLVVSKSYGIELNLPFRHIFWHVEFGISFLVIASFHVIRHLNYFTMGLKNST